MIHHPLILNQYRLREDFVFDSEELQALYEILLANGEVTPQDLSQLPDHVQQAWYRVLEEDLPDEVLEDGERSGNQRAEFCASIISL